MQKRKSDFGIIKQSPVNRKKATTKQPHIQIIEIFHVFTHLNFKTYCFLVSLEYTHYIACRGMIPPRGLLCYDTLLNIMIKLKF